MYTPLGEVTLKTGELMEIGVVFAPDIDHETELGDFLGHKPDNYKWHVDRCLTQPLDLLETRFYIGKLSGRLITNIMTTEYNGIGILGHVFTLPEQRRKGACKGLMDYQMRDFQDREGRMLYLGTGYDSAPYWIYHYFGFRSVYPEAGFMTYSTAPEFETQHFARDSALATKVKSVQWHDWIALTALTGIVDGDYLRSSTYGLTGPTNFEGGFLYLKQNLETDPQHHQSWLLQSETGAIVAFLILQIDEEQNGQLDLFAHPDFWDQTPKLIAAANLPSGKIVSQTESTAKERISVLKQQGFDQLSVETTQDGQQIVSFQYQRG